MLAGGEVSLHGKMSLQINEWLQNSLKLCLKLIAKCIKGKGLPGSSDGKASAYNVEDLSSIPGLERSSGERNGNPLQCSCLEKPMDGGAW